jgi:3-oxoacyl-[acyl-carrier protein] reductase
MKDSALRLQDKTILMTGPFNGTTQALLRTMTEFGSDIAYVSADTPNAGKYVDGINEAREANPHFGRAAFFHLPMSTEEEITEGFGRVAETFGRMDVLIDAGPLAWTDGPAAGLETARATAAKALPFFYAKQRGRIIFVFEDQSLARLNLPVAMDDDARAKLTALIADLARENRAKNVTVNGLALGVTEDFVLRHFAKVGSIRRAMDELSQSHDGLKLVESTDVGLGAAYVASALSGSLTGQVLRLTHGFHI